MRNLSLSLRWMLAVLFVAAIAVALSLQRREMRNRLEAAEPEVRAPAEASRIGSASEPLEATATAEARVAPATRVPIVRSRAARPGDGRSLRGRVEYLGLDPELSASRDMSLGVPRIHLTFVGVGGERESLFEELKGLEWSCKLPFKAEDIASVEVAGVVRRERLWHAVAGSESLPRDFDAEAVVQVELAPVTSIRVVEARTGEPIERFRLSAHTGDDVAARGSLASDSSLNLWTRRFELHPCFGWNVTPGEPCNLLVSADGYSDASIEVVFGSGLAHEVRLSRGGSAVLRWQPEAPREGFESFRLEGTFRLTVEPNAAAGASAAVPVARSEWFDWEDLWPNFTFEDNERRPEYPKLERSVEGLAPGRYRAGLVHRSGPLFEETRIAEAEFSIRIGRRTEVQLRNVASPGPVLVPLELEFAVPADWEAGKGSRVSISRRVDGTWSPTRALTFVAGSWRTRQELVQPGTFRVSVRGFRNFAQEFEFAGEQGTPVMIPVPILQHVQVTLAPIPRDTSSAKERLRWRYVEELGEFDAERGELPGSSEIHTDRLPIEVALSTTSRFKLVGEDWVRLEQPGEHRLTCVEKPFVRLRFRSDGEEASVPSLLKVRFRMPEEGFRLALQDRFRVDSSRFNELRVWFPDPGRYELEFRNLDGFAPIAPLALHIGDRHDELVELQLLPTR